jgi:hypothetical protein
MQSLAEALDAAPHKQEAYLRLRAVIARIVKRIWLLAVHRGKERLAWAQLDFTTGPHRVYNIRYRQSSKWVKGFWQVRSYTAHEYPATVMMEVDLADPHCADCMEGQLEGMFPATIMRGLFRGCPQHPLP